ncbi:MAG: MMPL family transporter [Thermoanaerobaculia bacterium]|nr:MMPL family transporter [Thermoanaerobaculia bacterium]
MTPPTTFRFRLTAISWLAATAVLVLAVLTTVDLSPRVSADFFFSTDDPELRSTAEIERLFPAGAQVLVRAAAPDVRSAAYAEKITALTSALRELPGVAAVRSLASGPFSPGDAFESPLWRRLLVAPDGRATTLVVETRPDTDSAALVTALEALTARLTAADFELRLSGVPYVVESIRRHLLADLRKFTLVAVLLFGAVITLLYRDPAIVTGALAACVASAATTLLLLGPLGLAIGMLTANLATIVFVVTLSHLVYLTANWQGLAQEVPAASGPELARLAVRRTLAPSFWCWVAALLGFGSLLFASAKPMRELGLAGCLGSTVALAVAFLLHPAFLAIARRPPGADRVTRDPFGGRRLGGASLAVAAAVALFAFGWPRLSTDPDLLSYFRPGTELHRGMAAIDAAGGSSPLAIVYQDGGNGHLDAPGVAERLARVQATLDRDPAVGTALSAAVLLEEARRSPLVGFLGEPQIFDLLAGPGFENVTRSFLTEDRTQGLMLLRMVEGGRIEARRVVVDRLTAAFRAEGFEPRLTGGLFELQRQLSELVRESVTTGLGGLALLFAAVGFGISRAVGTTVAMTFCLAATPLVLFGAMGFAGLPVDIISSPASNIAIGMGIDSMVHLVAAARRLRRGGLTGWAAWVEARAQLWRPIASAALILGAGFGLFVLSSFPPTQRFGIGVLGGILVAALVTLVVLPWLAHRLSPAGDRSTD